MLVKDGKTRDYIVGFTDLGNHDEFSTEMMEWRIATVGVIEYRYKSERNDTRMLDSMFGRSCNLTT